MKAIRIHNYGHSDQMKVEDLPRPRIDRDELLVRIRAAGVNPVDWKIREGYLKDVLPRDFPMTLGQDFAGDVVEVGVDVRGYDSGDKVFGFASGAYAEYATVPAALLTNVPNGLDYATAASLPTPGLTAYQLLTDVLRVSAGLRLLIHGAAGGVGSFAVQIARSRGARIFATASAKDEEYLRDLGVEDMVDYHRDHFQERFREMDAVIDLIGGQTLASSYQIVKPGGLVVSTVAAPDPVALSQRGIRGARFLMRRDAAQLAVLADLVDLGALKVRVGRIFGLADAPQAQDLSQKGKPKGKIILQVA